MPAWRCRTCTCTSSAARRWVLCSPDDDGCRYPRRRDEISAPDPIDPGGEPDSGPLGGGRPSRPPVVDYAGGQFRHRSAADAETQFRLGSVPKTFTAVLVMQCRDDGLLDLDDPIGDHVDVGQHSGLTIRRLISHTSGIQREPHGDVWDTLQAPDLDGLLADLEWTERVLPAGRRYHYSNLAVALLGYLVGVKRNSTWASVLQDRILTPLGLATVTVQPTGAAAVGYLVDAYSDS